MDVDRRAIDRARGEVLLGRYELLRQLGTGGAGVVWRAHDHVLDREVALKVLHADLAQDAQTAARFRAEATSAAKLTHPNAVMVFDIGRDGRRDVMVMELVDGPTLAELMAGGPLPAAMVAHLGSAVAAALGVAHHRGLLHRDVKPANVLLTADAVPKVADFGIARALGDATSRLTLPGSVMGTARYLAPEQLVDGPLDARVDVYALGLVLYEALTGRPPWGDGTAIEVASRRLEGDLPAPSRLRDDVPPGLDAVIARATRRDVDDRYVDGAALAAALAPLAIPDGHRQLLTRVRQTEVAHRMPAPDAPRTTVPAPTPARPTPRAGGATPPPPPSRPGREHPHTAALPPTTSRERGRPGSGSPATTPPGGGKDASAATGRAAGSSPKPPRRRRRRFRRFVGALALGGVLTVGVLGMTDTPIPGMEDLSRSVQGSRVSELFQDVRTGFNRLGG